VEVGAGPIEMAEPGELRFHGFSPDSWTFDAAGGTSSLTLVPRAFSLTADPEPCFVQAATTIELGAPFTPLTDGSVAVPALPDPVFGVGTESFEGRWTTGAIPDAEVRQRVDEAGLGACAAEVLGDAAEHEYRLDIGNERYTITDLSDRGDPVVVSEGWLQFWGLERSPTRFNARFSATDRPWWAWARMETSGGTLGFRNVGFAQETEDPSCVDRASAIAWLGAPFSRSP
jgi:hypothetical protein